MARYIEAVKTAEIISENLNVPLGDLVDIFAEIPTAEVEEKKIAKSVFILANTQQNILVVIAEIVTRINFSQTTHAHQKKEVGRSEKH